MSTVMYPTWSGFSSDPIMNDVEARTTLINHSIGIRLVAKTIDPRCDETKIISCGAHYRSKNGAAKSCSENIDAKLHHGFACITMRYPLHNYLARALTLECNTAGVHYTKSRRLAVPEKNKKTGEIEIGYHYVDFEVKGLGLKDLCVDTTVRSPFATGMIPKTKSVDVTKPLRNALSKERTYKAAVEKEGATFVVAAMTHLGVMSPDMLMLTHRIARARAAFDMYSIPVLEAMLRRRVMARLFKRVAINVLGLVDRCLSFEAPLRL